MDLTGFGKSGQLIDTITWSMVCPGRVKQWSLPQKWTIDLGWGVWWSARGSPSAKTIVWTIVWTISRSTSAPHNVSVDFHGLIMKSCLVSNPQFLIYTTRLEIGGPGVSFRARGMALVSIRVLLAAIAAGMSQLCGYWGG